MQFAHEVVERRRSIQGAINEVRHPSVLDVLSDDDFRILGDAIETAAPNNLEFALALARLTHAAARAKGFDRQIVDAALRLDALLPPDDTSRERETLLRDAYSIARRSGYARGGRAALARLGERAAASNDLDRARKLLQQQLEISDEASDAIEEVNSAILLGDILRREGEPLVSQVFYRRAQRSAERIDYPSGLAEALGRQVELLDPMTPPETVANLQQQALSAAKATGDLALQSRLLMQLAGTVEQLGQQEEAASLYEQGADLAQQTGDLNSEAQALASLEATSRQRGDLPALARHQRALMSLEDRIGNRAASGAWGIELGMTLLDLDDPPQALESFRRSLTMAQGSADPLLEQKALGGIGAAELAMNHPNEGIEAIMRALALSRSTNDPGFEAHWLSTLAQALWRFNYTEDALRAATDGLAVARRLDDSALQAQLLAMVGRIQLNLGQTTRARESFTRALDLAKRTRLTAEQIRLLSTLGTMALNQRQIHQASTFFTQALQVANERGDRAAAVRLHARLGQIAQEQRDSTAAIDHLRRAVEAAELIDNPPLLRRALSHLAAAQHRVGDPSAGTSYRRALQISQQLGERGAEALIRLNLGMLLAEQHHDQEALDNLYRAVTLSRDAGERGHDIAEQATAWIEQLGGGQSMSAGGRASWSDYDQEPEPRGTRGQRDRRSDFSEFGFGADDDRGGQALPPG
jgi:tetratricopeptide (TPR) repeat protein